MDTVVLIGGAIRIVIIGIVVTRKLDNAPQNVAVLLVKLADEFQNLVLLFTCGERDGQVCYIRTAVLVPNGIVGYFRGEIIDGPIIVSNPVGE